MKKIIIFAAVSCAMFGCTSQPLPVPPEQLFQQFCIASQTVNTIILTMPGASIDVMKSVNDVQPVIAKVCASGVTLNAENLNALLIDGLPLINIAISALPPATPDLASIKLAAALVPVIVPQIIAGLPVAVLK